MKVQILGTGCPKCRTLTERVETAVSQMGLDCEVVKVTDIKEIMAFGVMMTPGLAIDGEVRSTGRLLSVEEIKTVLEAAR
jgi:small redox-active disulfide protein 2